MKCNQITKDYLETRASQLIHITHRLSLTFPASYPGNIPPPKYTHTSTRYIHTHTHIIHGQYIARCGPANAYSGINARFLIKMPNIGPARLYGTLSLSLCAMAEGTNFPTRPIRRASTLPRPCFCVHTHTHTYIYLSMHRAGMRCARRKSTRRQVGLVFDRALQYAYLYVCMYG